MAESECVKALRAAQQVIDSQEEKMEGYVDVIQQQREVLLALKGASFTYAVVVGPDKRTISVDDEGALQKDPENSLKVMHNGQFVDVKDAPDLKLQPGDVVKMISTQHGLSILEKSSFEITFGPTVYVKDLKDAEHAEVDYSGGTRVVLTCGKKVEKGSKVILDENGILILKDLGKDSNEYTFKGSTGVTWDDIGGQEKAKDEIREAIEDPIQYKDFYKYYNKKSPKGILLWGPPGNGKTMFGKAIASSVAKMYGTTANGFIYVKGPEILNMYVGNSEERIRNLFKTAREFKKQTGSPAVLFIDEAEAILSARGSGRSSDVDKTIVPQFLSEMDGLDDSAAIVVLTTNRPDMLDSAVIREGRIDKKIKIGRPDIEAVKSIFKLNLKGTKVAPESEKEIVEKASTAIFDTSLSIYEITKKSGGVMQFTYANIINGAMIASIVNDSITMAIKRDVQCKKNLGVTTELVEKAIYNSYEQNLMMNHDAHLKDLEYELELNNDGIQTYKPIKANVTERETID